MFASMAAKSFCFANCSVKGRVNQLNSCFRREMGGHALKSVSLVRKPRAEYEVIARNTLNILQPHIPTLNSVPDLPDKEDFGDLDLLYKPQPGLDVREIVTQTLRPKEICVNGDVMSFDIGGDFQVDLIRCTNLAFARFFFSYADLGGMLGSLVHAHGLKLGQEGMWVRLGAEDGFAKLPLTEDVQAACDFMAVDFAKWQSGITCTQDVYDMVTACRFFRPDVLATKRSDQRPVLKRYLEQVARMPALIGPAPSAVAEAIRFFKREQQLEEIREAHRARAALAAKLNGHMVLALGVPDRRVGAVLKGFREAEGEEWIRTASGDAIEKRLAAYVTTLSQEAEKD